MREWLSCCLKVGSCVIKTPVKSWLALLPTGGRLKSCFHEVYFYLKYGFSAYDGRYTLYCIAVC